MADTAQLKQFLKEASEINSNLVNLLDGKDAEISSLQNQIKTLTNELNVKQASVNNEPLFSEDEISNLVIKMASLNLVDSNDIEDNKLTLSKSPKTLLSVFDTVLSKIASINSMEQGRGVKPEESTTKTASVNNNASYYLPKSTVAYHETLRREELEAASRFQSQY